MCPAFIRQEIESYVVLSVSVTSSLLSKSLGDRINNLTMCIAYQCFQGKEVAYCWDP